MCVWGGGREDRGKRDCERSHGCEGVRAASAAKAARTARIARTCEDSEPHQARSETFGVISRQANAGANCEPPWPVYLAPVFLSLGCPYVLGGHSTPPNSLAVGAHSTLPTRRLRRSTCVATTGVARACQRKAMPKDDPSMAWTWSRNVSSTESMFGKTSWTLPLRQFRSGPRFDGGEGL